MPADRVKPTITRTARRSTPMPTSALCLTDASGQPLVRILPRRHHHTPPPPTPIPQHEPTPVAMYLGTGTTDDPIEFISPRPTPPPQIKQEETTPTLATVALQAVDDALNTAATTLEVAEIAVAAENPNPGTVAGEQYQNTAPPMIPPYFAYRATQQPTMATLTAIAHIASTLSVEYRNITLDRVMWLAAQAYTIKEEEPTLTDEELEGAMRYKWRRLREE